MTRAWTLSRRACYKPRPMRVEPPAPPSAARLATQLTVAVVYMLVTVVHAVLVGWLVLIPRFRREALAWALVRPFWGRYTQWLAGMRVRVVGREHLPTTTRGCIYASNHESLLDILVLVREVGRAFLMKRSVLLSPVGWGAYLMGCVGFDRSSPEARRRALLESLEMATRSRSLVVFPEGTFGHEDGNLRRPHLNLIRHAWERGLPVVPLGHAGTRRALDGQRLPLRRGAEVVLVVRPPVRPADFHDGDGFAEHCWSEVTAAVVRARSSVAPGWPYPDRLPFDDAT